MKKRYKITIIYDGTDFCGWQTQPDVRTVQDVMENRLSIILGEDTAVYGASRTDAGVHAVGQVAHFDALEKYRPEILKRRLNSFLPDDIAISKIEVVDNSFSARYSSKWKLYKYWIHLEKDPLKRRYSWYFNRKVDIELLNKLVRLIIGEHNFGGFAKQIPASKSTICHISDARWCSSDNSSLYFEVKGNRFIHTMIRSLVGAMLDTVKESLKFSQFDEILRAGDRIHQFETAPPDGLFLIKIEY